MKRILRGLAAALLSAALLVAAGCGGGGDGGGSQTPPQGQVVKGPVNGAKISNTNTGVIGATTDANGKFTLFGGPYTSTGGTYHDLATNSDKAAPVLKAPANAANITALTTLIAANPALQAKIESLGIKFDDALTTVTAGNRDAIALNEAVGVALAIVTSSGATAAELSSLVVNIATQITNTTFTGEVASTVIGNLVKTAVTATAFTTPTVVAAVTNITTQITNTVAAVDTIPVGTTLTGATGGGSTGTIAQ